MDLMKMQIAATLLRKIYSLESDYAPDKSKPLTEKMRKSHLRI